MQPASFQRDRLHLLRRTGGDSGPASADDAITRLQRQHVVAWIAIAAVVLMGSVAFGVLSARLERLAPSGTTGSASQAPDRIGSSMPAPSRGSLLAGSGYVVARQRATVSSQVSGSVVEVAVVEGDFVRKGDVLARLDDRSARAERDLAEQQLRVTQAAIREAQARLEEAQADETRSRTLVARGLISAVAAEQTRTAVLASAARLDGAVAAAAAQQEQLAVRQRILLQHVIRAPFDGVVISRDAQVGEVVSPLSAGGGFTRTGIATVVDMRSLEIAIDINEGFIHRVSRGQRVRAVLDAYPDRSIEAHVLDIVPSADRQKGTVRVRIAFDAQDARILPEMAVKVVLE